MKKELFENWIVLCKELDTVHQIVLYSMAKKGFSADVKCANLIESNEALV